MGVEREGTEKKTKIHLNILFLYPNILCMPQHLGPCNICFKGVIFKKWLLSSSEIKRMLYFVSL